MIWSYFFPCLLIKIMFIWKVDLANRISIQDRKTFSFNISTKIFLARKETLKTANFDGSTVLKFVKVLQNQYVNLKQFLFPLTLHLMSLFEEAIRCSMANSTHFVVQFISFCDTNKIASGKLSRSTLFKQNRIEDKYSRWVFFISATTRGKL